MKLFVSAAALAIGIAGAAFAQAPAGSASTAAAPTVDGKPSPRQIGMIKAMDKDGDGKVSKAEFLAFQPKGRMAAAAADGKVTREEFMQRGPHGQRAAAGSPERKAKMDERRAELFKTMDKDGNGSISRDEFMGFTGGMMIRAAARFEGNRAEMFKRLDANNDGVVDTAEQAAAREAAFARMDRNGDGFITADELHRRGPRPTR